MEFLGKQNKHQSRRTERSALPTQKLFLNANSSYFIAQHFQPRGSRLAIAARLATEHDSPVHLIDNKQPMAYGCRSRAMSNKRVGVPG